MTARIPITPFHYGELEGSDIMSEHGGGYDPSIGVELRKGGRYVQLTAPACRDLAEWADAMIAPLRDNDNTAGVRSMERLADRCLAAARDLESAS